MKAIAKACQEIIISQKDKRFQNLLDCEFTYYDEPLFCPYQKELVTDESKVAVIEKGRQIGFSYTMAFRAVLKAVSNERDTVYMSYNRESAKDFMREVQRWSRIFNLSYTLYNEQCVDNNRISIFEINFLNLRKILAVSGDCTNLRGKPGADIIIDEVCYNQASMDELLAAAMATLIHGGTVRLGSTHAGEDSDFNQLIKKIRLGEVPYQLFRITFKDAINQGLYKKICNKNKEEWTEEKQSTWVKSIYDMYGIRADEELNAIPSNYSEEGKIFNNFRFLNVAELNLKDWDYIDFRYHDLAATKEKNDIKDSNYYSASIKLRYIYRLNKMVIHDWTADRLSPLEGDAKIEELAILDGAKSVQIIEQEPGSSGIKYVLIMQERLIGHGIFQCFPYAPKIDKVKRAIPAGNAIQSGEIMIDENIKDKDLLCNYLRRFSSVKQPLVTDLGDCLSGSYDFIKSEYNFMLTPK